MFRSAFIEDGRPFGYEDFTLLADAEKNFEKIKTFADVRYAAIYRIDARGLCGKPIKEWISSLYTQAIDKA